MISYRHLFSFEYPKYADYLKSLDDETLRDYFGYAMTEEAIDVMVDKVHREFTQHEFIIATINGKWVGVVHIAHKNNEAELGISVNPKFRRLGIGNNLISRATLWCRNRQLLNIYMHCVSRNVAVMALVKKHNLKIDRHYTEASARIVLPHPTIQSITEEHFKTNVDLAQSVVYNNMFFNFN
jgi:RimJ/RimL family protein N-acetyltransferase